MQLEVGKIVQGKVTGITKFGAFVELESGEVGMVHISEVASAYVNDISEHLTQGQTVTVKVLAINEDGKISLSIKRAMKPAQGKEGSGYRGSSQQGRGGYQKKEGAPRQNGGYNSSRPATYSNRPAQKPTSFEDMLSKFMASSDEKISDMKRNHEVSRRGGGQRRRG
ncbi:MAG: S1 RNA-binding domain-containing protein [Massiliimalia sp.]|jgi:S1 RNA binding domain protein